jgi:GSH-dependent disulfide-bond oxidoreductase
MMIADISLLGWVRNLVGYYGARELVAFDALSSSRRGWSEASPALRCSVDWRFRSEDSRCNSVPVI